MKYDLSRFFPGFEMEHRFAHMMADQQSHGVKMDEDHTRLLAHDLTVRWDELNDKMTEVLPTYVVDDGTYPEPFKLDGDLKAFIVKYCASSGVDPTIVAGPFTKVDWVQMRLTQLVKVKDWLLSLGWVPRMKTKGGDSWRLTDEDTKEPCPSLLMMEGSGRPIGELISEYNVVKHRLGVVNGWVMIGEENGWRMPAGAAGWTNTHRLRHTGLVNVPRVDKPWGDRMRGCFIADVGCTILGSDAAGLENRMLAHYANTPALTELILGKGFLDTEGLPEAIQEAWAEKQSFHNYCWALLHRYCEDINNTKTVEYAFFYGAQNGKLGTSALLNPDDQGFADKGAAIRVILEEQVPGLGALIDGVQKSGKRGYLIAIDRRQLLLRSNDHGFVMLHKCLNVILQGGGSIVVKRATIMAQDYLTEAGIPFDMLIHMHDEFQFQVRDEDVERAVPILDRAWNDAGKHYGLVLPIDGETKTGKSWAETH